MNLNLRQFYHACNPSKTIVVGNPEERRYYIDFSSVRGGKIIEELSRTIARLSPEDPTCQLFTGHIGCGKSTELLKLKAELGRLGKQYQNTISKGEYIPLGVCNTVLQLA